MFRREPNFHYIASPDRSPRFDTSQNHTAERRLLIHPRRGETELRAGIGRSIFPLPVSLIACEALWQFEKNKKTALAGNFKLIFRFEGVHYT